MTSVANIFLLSFAFEPQVRLKAAN